MKFKTLIAAILALIIGLHALPALARSASKIGSSTSSAAVTQTRSRMLEMPGGLSLLDHRLAYNVLNIADLDAGAVAKQLKEERKRTGK
jgi:hypothetical protein